MDSIQYLKEALKEFKKEFTEYEFNYGIDNCSNTHIVKVSNYEELKTNGKYTSIEYSLFDKYYSENFSGDLLFIDNNNSLVEIDQYFKDETFEFPYNKLFERTFLNSSKVDKVNNACSSEKNNEIFAGINNYALAA